MSQKQKETPLVPKTVEDPKVLKSLSANLLQGLFGRSNDPVFDCYGIKAEDLENFIGSEEAYKAAGSFVRQLQMIWRAKYPGAPQLRIYEPPKNKPVFESFEVPLPSDTELFSNKVVGTELAAIDRATASANVNTSEETMVSEKPSNKVDVPSSQPKPVSLPAFAENSLKPGQIPANPSKPTAVSDFKPTFHLPNCKVGAPFSAKIEGTDKSGRAVLVADLRFPDGFGLTFDPATQIVTGYPLLDGEFDLDLQWSFADVPGKVSGICKLTSNPDPKSLWKVIEPEGDLPYRKLHLDQKLLKGAGFSIAAASRRGRSHEHGGSFRDDDFFISDDPATGWSVLIVADGAGSAKSSREGSRIAVEMAGKHLVDNLASELGTKVSGLLGTWDSDASSQNAIGTEFHYFFHKMAGNAIQAIEQEAQAQNAPVKEYSTTLLAAAVKKDGANTFLATFWMGDGAIAAYGPRGTVKLMGTPDGGEFAGQTRFLDRNALADQGFGKRVRVGRLQNVSSVILMTDGVSDPYFETDNGLADPAKWDVLWDEIQPQLGDPAPEQRLVEWLHFFKQGHHDDRTVALLW